MNSAVPAGLVSSFQHTQDCVLGYFQVAPSGLDSRYKPRLLPGMSLDYCPV